MSYGVRYTPEAIRDLDALWDGVYEASKDYDTADRYVDGLMGKIAEKKEFPCFRHTSSLPRSFHWLLFSKL